MPGVGALRKGVLVKTGTPDGMNSVQDTFIGFTDIDNFHGQDELNIPFNRFNDVLRKYNVNTPKSLEYVFGQLNVGLGYNCYAVFKRSDNTIYSAYLSNGTFCMGPHADQLKLEF